MDSKHFKYKMQNKEYSDLTKAWLHKVCMKLCAYDVVCYNIENTANPILSNSGKTTM